MKFGKYAIFDNARYYLEKEPDIYVEFRPATAKDEVAIQKFLQEGPVTTGPSGVTRQSVRTSPEIAIEELSLLMVYCSAVGDDNKVLIDYESPIEKRREIVAGIPSDLLWELWRALGARVPGWGAVIPDSAAPKEGK